MKKVLTWIYKKIFECYALSEFNGFLSFEWVKQKAMSLPLSLKKDPNAHFPFGFPKFRGSWFPSQKSIERRLFLNGATNKTAKELSHDIYCDRRRGDTFYGRRVRLIPQAVKLVQ
jgi:hypothetical protein